MRADELREAYLSFFEGKGHTRYPSDSLVPANDPTLLFTGAGMNQFKEMFLGVGNLPFKRATTSQKCFRTGDLDNVGRTYYHHTFFEMLGNFSFGDYFKREAIHWAWELVTRILKLPSDKLWVSVYQDDDEAFDIWTKEVGFRRERVWRLGPKSNFWPANAPEDGPNGPCGPCSEIFWDFGSPGKDGDPDAARYCEFWNLVFQQYNRVGKNDLVPLKQAGVDTGMGFERMLAVMNGVRSNFETDLFRPIIDEVARIAGRKYAFEDPAGPLFRRIADHVRAGVFLVADGVKPSNEGRGYVARRVLRRAVRDGIALGIEKPFLHRLVPTIVGLMGRAYPEVKSAEPAATAFLLAEDEKFRETYFTGIELLERELRGLRGRTLPGETAFVLYDSHGFPYELCEEICAEKGIKVDRAGFEREMEKQRTRSREGSAMGGEVFVATALSALKRSVGETEFLGYEREEAESVAEAVIRGETPVDEITAKDGDTRILAKATPFYSESGGQVGDQGEISGPNGTFEVTDTKRIEGYVFHYGRVARGSIRRGDRLELRVDGRRRSEIRRNHSATHLLHAALRTILGKHVTQAGSLVAPDRLRFDFTHPRPVTAAELSAIEEWVQEEILRNSEVTTERMETTKAKALGAMALFGEKYGDVVRVVRIGTHSLELCGGTHVGSSAEIGTSLVTSEGGVAAGVRRIEMISGGGAFALARAQRGTLKDLAAALKTQPEALDQRVEALQKELKDLRKREAEQAKSSGLAAVDGLVKGAVVAKGVKVVAGVVDGDDPGALRTLSDAIRQKVGESVLLLAGRGKERSSLLATASDGAVKRGVRAGDVLRGLVERVGGKGGGKPQIAQGQAPAGEGLEAALDAARDEVVALLSR
ncbi:MAG TPA: alanine--tRNA ligase [Planctomycetota bacterium]|nr:alanine--tRNA ligase [Planctomycetota bacterium]